MALILAWTVPAGATLVPEVGFETLVAESEAIVHGSVVRSWTAWDEQRTAIWTHYEIRVADWLKGSRGATIRISEPGGSLDGLHTRVVGAPQYAVGEEVVVFADETPIGYLRTCGWSQGKFAISSGGDAGRKMVATTAGGAQIVRAEQRPQTPLQVFQKAELSSFLSRIRREVSAGGRR